MAYTDTLPSTPEAKERFKEIVELVKQERKFPRLSQIDMVDIMTEEYLSIIKNKLESS